MRNYIKIIFIIAIINFIELSISNTLSRGYIIFPLTFLFYSYYVYKSDQNINPIEAFLFGLFVDLISNSYFGLNTVLFCLITYLINIYSNSFKLFSNLQICIFFVPDDNNVPICSLDISVLHALPHANTSN